jgi:hypothetical protein
MLVHLRTLRTCSHAYAHLFQAHEWRLRVALDSAFCSFWLLAAWYANESRRRHSCSNVGYDDTSPGICRIDGRVRICGCKCASSTVVYPCTSASTASPLPTTCLTLHLVRCSSARVPRRSFYQLASTQTMMRLLPRIRTRACRDIRLLAAPRRRLSLAARRRAH